MAEDIPLPAPIPEPLPAPAPPIDIVEPKWEDEDVWVVEPAFGGEAEAMSIAYEDDYYYPEPEPYYCDPYYEDCGSYYGYDIYNYEKSSVHTIVWSSAWLAFAPVIIFNVLESDAYINHFG